MACDSPEAARTLRSLHGSDVERRRWGVENRSLIRRTRFSKHESRQTKCLLQQIERASSNSPVQPGGVIDLFVFVFVRTKLQCLLCTHPKDTEHHQAFVQKMMNVSLQLAVEIDHHVPAKDYLKFIERRIRCEIVLSKHHILS